MKYNFSSLVPGSIGGYLSADTIINALMPDSLPSFGQVAEPVLNGYQFTLAVVKVAAGFMLAVYGPSIKEGIDKQRRKRRARKQAAK